LTSCAGPSWTAPIRSLANDKAAELGYTYFRRDDNEARQANVLTHDEARRVAANIAKLPELLSGKHGDRR